MWSILKSFNRTLENIWAATFGREEARTDSDDTSQTKEDSDEKADCMIPCLMVTCGSGCPIIKVNPYTGRDEANDHQDLWFVTLSRYVRRN